MLKEALEFLYHQANDQAPVRIVKPAPEPPHVYGVMDKEGVIDWREAVPAPRAHVAAGLDPVVMFAIDRGGDEDVNSAVWYGRTGVVALLDDATRRDRVTFPLSFSPPLLRLADLESKKPYLNQRDFVRLLRVDFAECLGASGDLLAIVRSVRFINNASGESTVSQGKASVGRTIQQEVTGAGSVPEYVDLDLPVFAQASVPLRGVVKCAIDVDPAAGTFQIVPLPGQIERAVGDVEDRLGQTIRAMLNQADAKVPVYYGRPE